MTTQKTDFWCLPNQTLALIPMLENRIHTSIGSYIHLFYVVNYVSIAWTICCSWWCLLLEQVTQYPRRKNHRTEPKDMREWWRGRRCSIFHELHKWERLHPFITYSHVTYVTWIFFFFLREFQLMASVPNNNSSLLDRDINQFLV